MDFRIEVLEGVVAPGKVWKTLKEVFFYVISHPIIV